MEQQISKTDLDGYVKDMNNGAVMNTDNAGLAAYKKRRELMKKERSELEAVKEDINTLKDDMNDIKSMLKEIIRSQG